MTFEQFYKQHRARWLKLAETDVKLAIETAAEETWDAAHVLLYNEIIELEARVIFPENCTSNPFDCPDDDCDYCCEFYQTCDECGDLMHNDTVNGVDGDDRVFCHTCFDKLYG
jgi:hypothetical protein